MRRGLLVAASMPVAVLAGCIGGHEPDVDVVATFYPIAYVAIRIAGDDLSVATFVPPGVHPQAYEPTPGDAVRAARARLVLYNGAGLEPWLPELEAASAGILASATEGVTFVEDEGFPEDDAEEDDGDTHGATKLDPHVWLDPVRMAQVVRNVEAALVEVRPDRAEAFRTRADALVANLDALHGRYVEGLRQCEHRHMFVTHPAYGYIVVRYNLYQHGFSSLDLAAEATPRRFAEEVELARVLGSTAVFEAPDADPRLAERFAEAIGGRVFPLDPIEGLRNEDRAAGKNYLSVMDANLASLREGLRCE